MRISGRAALLHLAVLSLAQECRDTRPTAHWDAVRRLTKNIHGRPRRGARGLVFGAHRPQPGRDVGAHHANSLQTGTYTQGLPPRANLFGFTDIPEPLTVCELDRLHASCVARINMYRSGELGFSSGENPPREILNKSLQPLTHAAVADTCMNEMSLSEMYANGRGSVPSLCRGAHKYAWACRQATWGYANSCCYRWGTSFEDIEGALFRCLQSMWDEGMSENSNGVTGHFAAMKSTKKFVSCGFGFSDDGGVFMNQNFGSSIVGATPSFPPTRAPAPSTAPTSGPPTAPDDALCDDTCEYAPDGVCDDGGENSKYDVCVLGTDCTDCGIRKPGPTARPTAYPTPLPEARPTERPTKSPLRSPVPTTQAPSVSPTLFPTERPTERPTEQPTERPTEQQPTDSSDDALCNDGCDWFSDGICDDGGDNSAYDVCLYGSDCTDCGRRKPGKPSARPTDTPTSAPSPRPDATEPTMAKCSKKQCKRFHNKKLKCSKKPQKKWKCACAVFESGKCLP